MFFRTLLVILSFTGAAFLTQQLWTEYLSRKVRVEQAEVGLSHMKFPAITICDWRTSRRTQLNLTTLAPPTIIPGSVYNLKCGDKLECLQGADYGINVQIIAANRILRKEANHMIHFMNETGNSCYQLKGYTMYVPGQILTVKIIRNQTKMIHWTRVYINPTEEKFFEADTVLDWMTEGYYRFELSKKIKKRLPPPYSNCTANSTENSKLGGAYTVHKCTHQCILKHTENKCKAIPAFYQSYFEHQHKLQKDKQAEDCVREVVKNTSVEKTCYDKCAIPPCSEEIFHAVMTHTAKTDLSHTLDLDFLFPSLSETRIVEYPEYTWQELFSKFGGMLGLMTGASVLSFFEIFIYIALFVSERCS